ncbi:MAG: hypothetical protein LBR69_06260 [Endomicrobium sp.]|jgi:hypothetical protein|nr:hypothetical protein [Endomicrobium sp.]
MRNRNTNTLKLKKNPSAYAVWRLEQQLNYGLSENEKINRVELKKYLPVLNIDADTRKLCEYLLYGKKPSY